jgi:TetR/AcrR family transcriptional regulator
MTPRAATAVNGTLEWELESALLDNTFELLNNVGDRSPTLVRMLSMARYKKAEREEVLNETRQSLLQAAAETFAIEGYDGANVNSISKAAGFAKGTIYNYFPSKRALMLALVDEIAERHLAYVQARVMQEEDPRHRLERFFEAGFGFVAAYLAQARVMFNAINGHDVALKEHMFQAYQPMFQLVGKEIIAEGMAGGLFREVDPVFTASLLMNIYLGTGSQVDEEGQFWMEPAQVADFVLHALLRKD